MTDIKRTAGRPKLDPRSFRVVYSGSISDQNKLVMDGWLKGLRQTNPDAHPGTLLDLVITERIARLAVKAPGAATTPPPGAPSLSRRQAQPKTANRQLQRKP